MSSKSLKDLKQEYASKNNFVESENTSILDLKRRYNAPNVAKDIKSRLEQWNKDSQSLLDGYNSRFFDKDGQYITNTFRSSEDAGNWLYDAETKREALEAETNSIKSLLTDYGEYFDENIVKDINNMLDGNTKTINSVVSNALIDKEYWDRFENETAWKDAKKLSELYSMTLAEIQPYLDATAKTEEEKKARISALNSERSAIKSKLQQHNRGNKQYNTPDKKKAAEDRVKAIDRQIESLEKSENGIAYTTSSGQNITWQKLYDDKKADEMASVADRDSKWYDPNFSNYVNIGKKYYDEGHPENPSIPDVNFDQKGYNSAAVKEVDEYREKLHSFEYNNMTEEERQIYHYYLGKAVEEANGGIVSEETAKKYVDSITEAINARHAQKMANDFKNEGKLTQLSFSLYSGIENWATGVKNFFSSEDYIPPTATALASQMVREDLAEDGWGWKVAYDVGNTTANMFPSIALSYIPYVGQGLSLASTGISSAGHAYAEALNNGYTKGQARGYSLLVGGSEAGLQYLLGGISRLGGVATKGATSKIATKLASNVGNAYAKIAISSGVKLVGSMVSEFGEEYLQEVLTPVFKNIALGTEEDVKLLSTDALYAGFLGALSAALLEGGSVIGGEIGTYKTGKSIVEKGQAENLAKLGMSFAADTVARKIASKVNKNTDAYTLGQLLHEVGADHLSAQNIADITAELKRKGMTLSDAQSIAKWLNKAVEGKYFTKGQISALENNEIISEVFRDVVLNKDSSVNQRVQLYQSVNENLAQERTKATAKSEKLKVLDETSPKAEKTSTNVVSYSSEYIESVAKVYEEMGMSPEQAKSIAMAQLSQSDSNTSSSDTKNSSESKFEVSDDGKTINLKTGEAVAISKIDSISESGEVKLTVDNGVVVKASDVSFGTVAERAFIEEISNLKLGKNRISTASANALYQNAMAHLKSNPDMTLDEATTLIKGLAESYIYGVYNFGEDRLTATDENGRKIYYAGEISDSARRLAYKLGRNDSVDKTKAEQKVIDDLISNAEPKSIKKGLGKLVYEDGIQVDETSLTDTQKANIKGIELLSKITNIEFHIFRSDKAGETYMYTMLDGTVTSANGWYVAGTNEIWVDINAGNFGQGTMIRTAAHEISHYIKEWSPKQWQAMADLLMDTFAKNGVDTQRMLNKQKDKIRRRYNKENMPSEPELTDKAYEEFVCDALTDMLTDGSIVNFIAEVKQKNKSLGKKLLDAIKNLLSSWGIIIDDYKGGELETDEAQALSQFEDVFKKLQEMYQNALMDADAAYAAVGNVQAQKNTTAEGDVKYEDRPFAEQVDDVLEGIFERTNAVFVGATPKILKDVGLNGDLPMLTTAKHIRDANNPKNTKKHHHGLTEKQIKKIPEKIANPVMIMDSLDETRNSIVVVTDMVDPDNSPVVVSIKTDGKGMYNNIEIDSNFLTGYYGRDGFAYFIENNVLADTFLYINKEKATTLSTESSTSWLEQLKNYDFDIIIRKTKANVKENSEKLYSERDYPVDPDVDNTVKNAYASTKGTMHELSSITADQNKAINRLVNQTKDNSYRGKFEGGKHRFSDTAIRHIIAEHGDFLREGLRAQLPMTLTDIARHLSAIKDNKNPSSIKATRTKRGFPSVLTSYEVNGYTLYAEEITKPLGQNKPNDLIGHTMYKAPTLATAAALATSARALPKRQSEVLCEYYMPNSTDLSMGNFVADKNGNPVQLYFVSKNNSPKADVLLGGLIPLSSDSANFTDKSGQITQGYVRCKKPFYITQDNRVFSNSETNVAQKIEELKKQGYDCFIFDKTVGDNYMVAVVNKAQVIQKQPTRIFSERDSSTSNRSILANSLESAAQNDIERKKLAQYKEKISLIEAEEKRLAEIQKQLFTKGAVEPAQRKKLQFEARQISNRINIYDRQLLNLESTTALKNVLNREKTLAMKKQKQKDAELLKQYREKAAKNQRELMERHQESRKKATESRHKTAMRHQIKNVVNELNTLLTHGNKKKHVPEDLKVAVAEVLELFNMDTVSAEERVAKLKSDLMKAKTPEKIQEISRKIDNIQAMGDKFKAKLDKLKSAYDTIKSSADPEIAGGFDEVVSSRIEYVAAKVGKTPLRNMTLEQLEMVYDVYTMVLNNIREANTLFKKDNAETIQNYASRVIGEVKQAGGVREYKSLMPKVKEFFWNNLKPIFAFEKIGSKTLTSLFEDVRKGEDTWAVDITEAKDYSDSKQEKYNYKKWDFDKKYDFKTTDGKQFSLTLEQMLSLYAYSKRPQADEHLRVGGFVFDDSIEVYKENVEVKEDGEKKKKKSIIKYKVNIKSPHQISTDTLADIVGSLTNEQKAFVDEMQTYLSDVMGAKGNEVSMTLYNIRLFKEKNYFPLKSAQQFMFEQNEVAGEVKIKNSGFTESTVEHANNPIILNNFMDVWANHVNDMSMYHSFVVPLENFNRVFNYQTRRVEGMPAVSVKETLHNAYESYAVEYIRQLLTDLNGGARSDPRESTAKKLLSTFKKAKVFSSASVVIQQPSAVARALALIDEKYFDFNPKLIKHKERWEELKKYAPVAIIKEMGRFDTDMGLSTAEYIKGQKTFMQKVEDVLSKAPAYADELTWVHIWEAVKRETKAKHPDLKVGTEEFFKTAGERFTEIISKTQVYDSVLSRSANMRSKSGLMAMWTAFMAEPTTSINMIEQGLRLWKRGYKRLALKQLKGVGASIILNSVLVSLVYAMRDDDEDETYLEKYLGSFVSEIVDGFNPLTYFPMVKDVWSLLQGYDVERSDMSLFSDAIDSLRGIVKTLASYDEDITDEELQKFKEDMVGSSLKLVDGVAALFGIPAGNIRRDINSIINTYKTVNNGASTSGLSLKNELIESVKDVTPVWGWLPDEQKTDKLYDAVINGDTSYIDRLKNGYKNDKAYETALRKALRENDPRIKKAAEARFDGDFSEYDRLFEEIEAEGNFEFGTIRSAIDAEFNKLDDGDKDESSEDGTGEEKIESIYRTSDINVAFENGDTSSALEIIGDIVKVKTENYINDGEKKQDAEKKAKSSVKSSMTNYWKPLYINAYQNKDNDEMKRIRNVLLSSGLYGRANDVVKTGQEWIKSSK